jgi:hypothetical protein
VFDVCLCAFARSLARCVRACVCACLRDLARSLARSPAPSLLRSFARSFVLRCPGTWLDAAAACARVCMCALLMLRVGARACVRGSLVVCAAAAAAAWEPPSAWSVACVSVLESFVLRREVANMVRDDRFCCVPVPLLGPRPAWLQACSLP